MENRELEIRIAEFENDNYTYEDLHETESELDEQLQIVAADLHEQTVEEFVLPFDFDVEMEINALKFPVPKTVFQESFNSFIDYLIDNKNLLMKFCAGEWKTLSELFADNVSGCDLKSAVSQSHLQLFYQKCQEHMTSAEYKSTCLELFNPDEKDLNVEFSVCFNLVLTLRKVLLGEKAKNLQYESTEINQRSVQEKERMNETARGKVRFIGGYVIAKLRHSCIKAINHNIHKTSANAIALYEQSKCCLQILDSIQQSEYTLNMTSEDVASLWETSRKQNVNRSLTNISDNAFYFFTHVIDCCLQLLNGINLTKYGSSLYEFVQHSLSKNVELYKEFVNLCNCKSSVTSVQGKENDDDAVCLHTCVDEMLFNICVLEDLYEKVLHKLVSVLTKQFTRDAILALSVTKKMEHRKQIKVSDTKKICVNNLNFSSIQTDLSHNKIASHCMLKAALSQEKQVLQNFTVKQLLLLCKAYNCKAKGKKNIIINILQEYIIKEDHMVNPDIFDESL